MKKNITSRRLATCAFLGLCLASATPVFGEDAPLSLSSPPPAVTALSSPAALVAPARLRQQMPLVQWRRREALNHLFQFDDAALAARTPLILLPGRAEEFQQSAWWKKLRLMTRDNKPFNERYKLYAFIYNSKDELSVQAHDFAREAKAYFHDLPAQGRALTLVSYSLGGMITSEAMQDVELNALVERVFAIASPFHGSPMFDPEWFRQYLRPQNHSPIRQFWDRTAYRLYLLGKNNLQEGLRWRNFDGSKPLYGKPEVYGHVLVAPQEPYRDPPLVAPFKRKLVIYASYLENPYTDPEKFRKKGVGNLIRMPLYLPRAVLGSFLPIYGKNVHSVFSYMNIQLANLPTYAPDAPLGKNEHLYRYNDGVFPLSSMLFLPPRDQPYHESFRDMIPLIDVQMARVFVNIDHLHIGEYGFSRGRIKASDRLHPADGAHTPNEWLILDLMRKTPFPAVSR